MGLQALQEKIAGRKRTVIIKMEGNFFEGFVAQWYNPLTLQPERSGGVGSIPGKASPLERHDKGPRTRLPLSYCCDPSAWR